MTDFTNFATMNVLPADNGFLLSWVEPVVIRGQIPSGGEIHESQSTKTESADPIEAPEPEQRMLKTMTDMMQTVTQPIVDMQRRQVYRLVAKSRVLKQDEDPKDAFIALTRAQRLLAYLNTQGAIAECAAPTPSTPSMSGIHVIRASELGGPTPFGRIISPCSDHAPKAKKAKPRRRKKSG